MPCAAAAALERRSEPASANEAVAHRVAAMTADAFILVWWWGYVVVIEVCTNLCCELVKSCVIKFYLSNFHDDRADLYHTQTHRHYHKKCDSCGHIYFNIYAAAVRIRIYMKSF